MNQTIHWQETAQGTEIFVGNCKIGTAEKLADTTDTFTMVEDGVLCWTRTCKEATEDMRMRFVTAYPCTYQMIPALQYNENRCNHIKDYIDVHNATASEEEKKARPLPTFFLGNIDPETDKPWKFIWHRASVPGATYSEGKISVQSPTLSTGMFLPPDQLDGACSIYTDEAHTYHEMLWPEQDSLLRRMSDLEKYVYPPKSRNIFRVMLVLSCTENNRLDWHNLLNTAWKQYYTLKAPCRNYEDLWNLGVEYAKLLYTEEPDGFKGFSIGLIWEGKWVKRSKQKYEIGWCGQNASLANSLLAHAAMTGDKDAAEKGISVLDAWIAAQKSTGLIPTHYDDNMYTNGYSKTVDACNLGTAAVQFFEAADRAAALGYDRPQYTEMACRICDFALKVMNENGRIGKSWLEADLTPAVKEGTTGAFLSMALCEGAKRTGRTDYLEGAERSCRYYVQELTENGFTTAGALDVFSIDKESSIPLLKGNLMLYYLTNKNEFLENAEKAAWYLSTWQWHYTRNYPQGTLLHSMNFDTFGGTAVSIHGGMDPFALNYIHEIRDLAELTGNPQWKERANGIWRHGQMCISEGDMIIDGKDPRPAGSQDESVNLTISAQDTFCEPSQWLVAWPTAFRLEALRRILPADGDRQGRIF